MTRPREFNEELALKRAMEVFWTKGYEQTSIDDLLEAMGIQRGSFYNAFESKHDVYLRALERYFAHITEEGPFAGFNEDADSVRDLRSLLMHFIDSVTQSEGPSGCFFAHACSEARGRDKDVKRIVEDGLRRVGTRMAEVIESALEKHEIEGQIDARKMALTMLAVAYGFQVLSAAGMQREELEGGAEQFFAAVAG